MANNTWDRKASPPPPLFLGQKERDLVKQINDELEEGVVGQQILYYPISIENTQYHELYGECINKNFLNPIHVFCLVEWHGRETHSENGYIDNLSSLTVHFHSRRLQDDQDLFVSEGDFIQYGDRFYEIVSLNEPQLLFGQIDKKVEISAKCIRSREGLFNG